MINNEIRTSPSVGSTPNDLVIHWNSVIIHEVAPDCEAVPTPANENMGASKASPRPSRRLEATPPDTITLTRTGYRRKRNVMNCVTFTKRPAFSSSELGKALQGRACYVSETSAIILLKFA
jgi:hypothetical protein